MSITHIHQRLDLVRIHANAKKVLYLNIYENIHILYLMKIMSKVAGMIIDIIINSIYVVKLSSNTNYVVKNCSVIL